MPQPATHRVTGRVIAIHRLVNFKKPKAETKAYPIKLYIAYNSPFTGIQKVTVFKVSAEDNLIPLSVEQKRTVQRSIILGTMLDTLLTEGYSSQQVGDIIASSELPATRFKSKQEWRILAYPLPAIVNIGLVKGSEKSSVDWPQTRQHIIASGLV